ncbi:MAG TPA: Hsp70 family protein, partial [Streptosporangiaceae bacterium]|nr:Hsp70 family protein [Streptosporangiaceae bacterium]
GKCHLTGFAPAHRGVPRVDVIFDMDADGVLNVSAKDLGSEKREIVVTRTDSALSQEEIARMAANVAGALGG